MSLFLYLAVEETGGSICYDLYAIINHYGTMSSGHYTADIKHFASGLWFSISDCRYVLKFAMQVVA